MAIGRLHVNLKGNGFRNQSAQRFVALRKMAHGVVEVKSKVIWWSIDGHGRRKTIARRNRVGKENLQGRESLMACGRFCRGRLLRRALFRLIGERPYPRRD